MKYLNALIGTIKELPQLYLHILLTEEDDVTVARCLDFSVSSHGEDEKQALLSLNDSIRDYMDYAIKRGAFNEIIDPEEERFWQIFRELELQNGIKYIHTNANLLKIGKKMEVSYA